MQPVSTYTVPSSPQHWSMTPLPSYLEYVAVILVIVSLSPHQCVSELLPAVTLLRQSPVLEKNLLWYKQAPAAARVLLKSTYMHRQQQTHIFTRTRCGETIDMCSITLTFTLQNITSEHTNTHMHWVPECCTVLYLIRICVCFECFYVIYRPKLAT